MLVVLAGAALTGCSQEDLEINDSTTETVDQGHYVSLDQALINLMPYYNEAAGTTRSSVLPLVSNFETLTVRNQTRSSEEVAPYYIVNFADNSGFAVLSADDRLLPVYAFSTSGHIALADTVTNPTLSYFFNTLLQQEADNLDTGDTLLNLENTSELTNKFTIIVNPLLSDQVSLWNQNEPYNEYCPNKYPVGCAALSVAQICSWYGIPEKFSFTENKNTETITLNWSNLRQALPTNSASMKILAKFLAYLGSKDLLDMRYKEGNSTIDTTLNIINTIKKLGFSKCNERTYNLQGAKALLENHNTPFIISSVFGKSEEKNGEFVLNFNPTDGHIFIIDGIASNTLIVSSPTIPPTYSSATFYYVHCVWGQKDHSNGFFYNPISSSRMNVLPPYSTTTNGLSIPSGWDDYTKLQHYFIIQ